MRSATPGGGRCEGLEPGSCIAVSLATLRHPSHGGLEALAPGGQRGGLLADECVPLLVYVRHGHVIVELLGLSATNAWGHVSCKARQSLARVGLRGDAKGRSGR